MYSILENNVFNISEWWIIFDVITCFIYIINIFFRNYAPQLVINIFEVGYKDLRDGIKTIVENYWNVLNDLIRR